MEEAAPFLTDLQQHEQNRIIVANAAILQGYQEGGYYSECISFFHTLESSDPTLKRLTDPRGFFAVILSAYQQHDYAEVLRIYEYVKARGIWPRREVVYALTEIFTKGEFWKVAYDHRMSSLVSRQEKEELVEESDCDCNCSCKQKANEGIEECKQASECIISSSPSIPPISDEWKSHVLAQCRVSQLISGALIMNEFCKRNSESLIVENARGDLMIKVLTYEETQRRMRLIGAFIEIVEEYKHPKDSQRRLIVKSVKNDNIVRDILEKELYPKIEYVEKVGKRGKGNL